MLAYFNYKVINFIFLLKYFFTFLSHFYIRSTKLHFGTLSSPEPPGENRVARSNALKKIIGSAEKNRVGREPEPQVFFLRPIKIMLYIFNENKGKK
jgi:hypothetical protein